MNGQAKQKGNGNKAQRKTERQWKQRTAENRKAVETKNNGKQKGSGNKEQRKTERQWKQRTTENRKAKATLRKRKLELTHF